MFHAPRVERISPQPGTRFILRRGDVFRIIDPTDEQVLDLTAHADDDHAGGPSSGCSID